MSTQLELSGFGTSKALFSPDPVADPHGRLYEYLLFLGIFPQPGDAERLTSAADRLCSQRGLHGRLTDTHRLHITLHSLGSYLDASIPQAAVDAAKAAATGLNWPAFPIVFDRVGPHPAGGAFILQCDPFSSGAIARLRSTLRKALSRAGMKAKPSKMPHMTLLYDNKREVDTQPIEPLRWTATRFALILSHRGLHHHQWIGEWSMAGAPC